MYLQKAENYYNQGGSPAGWSFGWDNKQPGNAAILARITNNWKYKNGLREHCNTAKYKTTRQGQVFWDKWGSNRYACNTGLICLEVLLLRLIMLIRKLFFTENISNPRLQNKVLKLLY